MALDELIAQLTNPQEFTRLCNAVFTDIYGDAFQVIDGTRGDNGNDGYVSSESRMLAMHCPIKPEQKTDAGYIAKIKSDLSKAATLKCDKKYSIDAWTFITPRKLSDDVIAEMRAFGDSLGIRVSHQESTFLANELYRRGHLLKGFPCLQQPDLAEKIDQVLAILTNTRHIASTEPVSDIGKLPPVTDEDGDARFQVLVAGIPTQEAKVELKAMAYRTTDPILEINAILALFRWFSPADDDREELAAFAARGVMRAKLCGLVDAQAILSAHKAAMIMWDFNTLYVETYFSNIADNLISFGITPVEQSQQRLAKLRTLDESWRGETVVAMDLIKESRDPETVAAVLLLTGTNIGQLAHTHRLVGDNSGADRFLGECKALLMAAKDTYGTVGDELGAANAVFNLANQVRWHDGKEEALVIVKTTIPVAEKHGDRLLLQKAKWLQQTLESGEMPDYAAGERRPWTTTP